jgi:hypothetical protein
MKLYFCSACQWLVEINGTDPDKMVYCTDLGKKAPLIKAIRTKWFNAKNPPVRQGWYEIRNVCSERVFWNGEKFVRNGKPFRYPSEIKWRGLTPNEVVMQS